MKQPRIMIVGDSVRDEWILTEPKQTFEGTTCYEQKGRLSLPGGAANVARQLVHLDCKVDLLSPVDGVLYDTISHECSLSRIYYSEVINSIKYRLCDSNWKTILRYDHEQEDPSPKVRYRIIKEAMDILERETVNVLILSDYGKGLLDSENTRKLIEAATNQGCIVIADPKHLPVWSYRGAVVKCNSHYIERHNLDPKHKSWLSDKIKLPDIIVTNGEGNVYGVLEGRPFEIYAKKQEEVVSSVGAGDCFIAHLAYAWANDISGLLGVIQADRACRNYVKRPFCEPLFPNEAKGTKIVSAEEFIYLRPVRHSRQKIVASNGCFEYLHNGHIHTLRWAKDQGDVLVVMVNDDFGVRQLKGDGRPVQSLADRMQVLEALEFVDYVVPFSGIDPRNALQTIKPDILVKGYDYESKKVLTVDDVSVVIAPRGVCQLHVSDFLSVSQDAYEQIQE